MLLEISSGALFELLHNSPVTVLVLNGKSVVEQFQEIGDVRLTRQEMPTWSLRRGQAGAVSGHSYKGSVRKLGGIDMGREMLILGFNHNIQSSFGVTKQVRESIRDWVASTVREAEL
jgi:hypothetical protein